jgi:hypothetical protein
MLRRVILVSWNPEGISAQIRVIAGNKQWDASFLETKASTTLFAYFGAERAEFLCSEDVLVHLRNTLLHFKANPAFEQSTPPEEVHRELFDKLKNRNILAEDAQGSDGTQTFLFQMKAVAKWLCSTAAQMIETSVYEFLRVR